MTDPVTFDEGGRTVTYLRNDVCPPGMTMPHTHLHQIEIRRPSGAIIERWVYGSLEVAVPYLYSTSGDVEVEWTCLAEPKETQVTMNRKRRGTAREAAVEMMRIVDQWTDDADFGESSQTTNVALLGIGYALLDLADAVRSLRTEERSLL